MYQQYVLDYHQDRIGHLLLEDGLLISASVDSWVYLYDYPNHEVVHKFKKKGKICSIAYSSENRCLFLGSEEENILKINIDDFTNKKSISSITPN